MIELNRFYTMINEERNNLENNSLEVKGKNIITFITEIQKFTENEKIW